MITILGSGMTALTAAKYLAKHNPVVLEEGKEPASYTPRPMRFLSPALGDLFDVSFESILYQAAVQPWRNPIADALAYSKKCIGKTWNTNALIGLDGQFQRRYIAPESLFGIMREVVPVQYGAQYVFGQYPTISTLPMPVLMERLGYKHDIEFKTVPSAIVRGQLANFDAYTKLLLPDPALPASEIRTVGSELEVEIPRPFGDFEDWFEKWEDDSWRECAYNAAEYIGGAVVSNVTWEKSERSKLVMINNHERMKFLEFARKEFNIFCVGRYAQWWLGYSIEDAIVALGEIEQQLENGGRLN